MIELLLIAVVPVLFVAGAVAGIALGVKINRIRRGR